MSDDRKPPPLPVTDRDEAPLYLARYLQRKKDAVTGGDLEAEDTEAPLYLRRFRQRPTPNETDPAAAPLYQRVELGMQRSLSADNRNKEIAAPPEARKVVANDIYLVRHGETQGYSTESGLTPLGTWQAHGWGHALSTRLEEGEAVVIRHADTSRASETGTQIHRGLVDGVAMFEKDVKVFEPEVMVEFRNFAIATPDGLRDITAAFRRYYSLLEEFERTALGDRPLWLVEVDRFWRTQQSGGDPIGHWLTVPMLHFEPPAMVVRRFWAGLRRLAADYPDARLVIATHSGPIRAFATAALGYDPGEPYNVEHVRVKLLEGGSEAIVSYRNRFQQIRLPEIQSLPTWDPDERWSPK
ncbi:MAG TPA: histidine phosphatase family protein [Acidimicrobiia bacterium]|nr:histidine phosphatase family protein [Acidimicrobiia bacterium]